MFVLIWVTLLFTVGGSGADTVASLGKGERCEFGFCITLNEEEITAEAGLCVVIPCSFTNTSYSKPQNMVWLKCEPSKEKCGNSNMIFYEDNTKVQSGFRGRVSLLEPDISHKNCSIIINDLTESDSGSYQFRVYGNRTGFMFRPRATVSVKGLTQKPKVMISVPLTEGQQTTLTCTAPGLCSGSDPEITWTWRGRGENDSHITGNITAFKTESLTAVSKRHSSTLTFNLSATQHHCTVVTCKVSFSNNITTEETVTLSITDPVQQCGSCSAVLPWVITAVSLIVNVICIICVLFLWNTRKKVKSSQEDRTYMSLRKTEPSSEYEVIERRLK